MSADRWDIVEPPDGDESPTVRDREEAAPLIDTRRVRAVMLERRALHRRSLWSATTALLTTLLAIYAGWTAAVGPHAFGRYSRLGWGIAAVMMGRFAIVWSQRWQRAQADWHAAQTRSEEPSQPDFSTLSDGSHAAEQLRSMVGRHRESPEHLQSAPDHG